jgi:hypothetical protein
MNANSHNYNEYKQMRITLIFIIFFLSLSTNGQVDAIDTIPLSVQVKEKNTNLQPALYINGKFSYNLLMNTLDPLSIDSIHLEKKDIEIENIKYHGQVFLKMKNDYIPQIISLTDLATKHTNLNDGLTVFMVDNDIIRENYDHCFVDENYILKIIVETIEMEKENVNVIRLLTKSKENIEKSKQIYIRGLDEISMN